jgi:NAD(P)-dependent dehydrogenase (short-subunit alcohol dehydrogenase family)
VPTVLITGATSGLGRQLAHDLHRRAWNVLVHGRNEDKVHTVAEEVGGRPFVADLSSLAEVHRLAQEVGDAVDRLDVLVNNAGIVSRERRLSADGCELSFAVNYLAGFVLTLELLPLLRTSAPARVVNVSSIGQSEVDFGDPMLEHGYSAMRGYSQSKLAQILFTFELADRMPDREVTVNALHPATLMDTQMVRQSFGHATSTVREGADATLRLIADPDLDGVTGRYFDGQDESRAHPQAYDPAARRQLWELSERLAGTASSAET